MPTLAHLRARGALLFEAYICDDHEVARQPEYPFAFEDPATYTRTGSTFTVVSFTL